MLLLFLQLIIRQVLFFGVSVIIFASFIVDPFVYIDWISVNLNWNFSLGVLEVVYGTYPNQIYGFSSPAALWKVVARVLVGCSDLFASIYCFSWSIISFKFSVKALFCLLLTCVYHIYWISVHWSWNLSSGVLENFQWAISKPDTRICFPHRFLEGRGKGASFCGFTCIH